ncbi:helix-turn-helix domain-containing protein [Pseudoflavonifractor sp. MSJ-37]|uniref:helix-turn-helix domain-containing protein n=1 Tax=Pseudoflavonifractor sp. MSJ-37 TaxID=2841531 RepID=UPI001C112DB2|nr:helix-turn-helix transcriptional regulator [Pseudoflavonifractor sp. MSJ-37]MBU5434293.1 helix-turn-helix transcriptional regulator [Pseudoflavonifractor sp. MSJ-37]
MFINKTKDGRNNISGPQIAARRKERGLSQRALADQVQLLGLDIDKNAVQRIESGQRFVTDIELAAFAAYFQTTVDALLERADDPA